MPVIREADVVMANARRLLDAAALFDIPTLFTEQNAKGPGGIVPDFAPCRAPDFLDRLPGGRALVVAGCEAHVCVLQTVLGLLVHGRKVYLVTVAIGSRRPDSRDTGMSRPERHGAEPVTTEMVIFEWLHTAEHPRFREGIDLIR